MELQILDRKTFELTPLSPVILANARSDKVKAEIFRSMIEVNTGICSDAHQVRNDLAQTYSLLEKICAPLGVALAAAGTHPTARYNERQVFPEKRFIELIDRNQWIARRLVIFGLHVHLGMPNGEVAVAMHNALLRYLPVFLALSASSPFNHGDDTELASSRITFFEATPTGGHPCDIPSWQHFENMVDKLKASDSIRTLKDIWWDLRICPDFGTLEVRICDCPATLEETVAVTALLHALALDLQERIMIGEEFPAPPDWIVRENKWRASRWGIDSRLIISEDGRTLPMATVLEDLIRQAWPHVDRLGYQDEVGMLRRMLVWGPSYERQRLVAAKSNGDLKCVTERLVVEFERRFPIWDIEFDRY